MLGRVSLLRGDLAEATELLAAAGDLAQRDHWLSFLPWPQAMLGQAWLSLGDLDAAARTLEQSFARACQIGDPCWEGISARGLALLAEAQGEVDRAFAVLLDARARANRLADPYVWLDVHILDALCEIGRRHGHPLTATGRTPCSTGPRVPACASSRCARCSTRPHPESGGTRRRPRCWPSTSTTPCSAPGRRGRRALTPARDVIRRGRQDDQNV